jgi:hypothetical protein
MVNEVSRRAAFLVVDPLPETSLTPEYRHAPAATYLADFLKQS